MGCNHAVPIVYPLGANLFPRSRVICGSSCTFWLRYQVTPVCPLKTNFVVKPNLSKYPSAQEGVVNWN
jgi:hypothetical protein